MENVKKFIIENLTKNKKIVAKILGLNIKILIAFICHNLNKKYKNQNQGLKNYKQKIIKCFIIKFY